MIGWDTETRLFRPGLMAPAMVCLSYAEADDDFDIVGDVVHVRDAKPHLQRILGGPSTAANAPYDLAVVGARFPDLMGLVFEALAAGNVYDVQMRQKLLDIALGKYRRVFKVVQGKRRSLGYSLEDLALRHLDWQLEKTEWHLRYAELENLPISEWPQGAVDYAKFDAVAGLGVHLVQDLEAERIEEEHHLADVLGNQAAQMRAHWGLHLAACWGIRTCPYAVRELEDRVRREWEATKEYLVKEKIVRPNGSRNTKLAKERMLYAAVHHDAPVKLTETGEKKVAEGDLTYDEALASGLISLDEDSCEASGDEVLVKYARYGSLIKLQSTYVRALWGGVAVPIHTYFEPLAETGRTTSSGPNLQNPYRNPFAARMSGTYDPQDYVGYPVRPDQPLGVRDCFVARPGCAFIACDYDKAELHALAQVCHTVFGYSRLGDRLREGFDPHLDMAAQILGITYEDAKWRLKSADKEVKDKRQMAKAANFGYPGGLGAESFREWARKSYGVTLTSEEAKWLKQHWLDTWPEMVEYFRWINSLSGYDGEATVRHFFSGRWRGRIPYTVTCNTFFQGLTADGAKAAMWELTRRQFTEPKSALYGTHIVNFIHDEFIIEAPEYIVHEAALEMRQVMVDEYNKFTPDVPVQASPVAMYRWMKDPAPTYVDGGRLVPTLSPHDYLRTQGQA